jgi:hypothetical protein
MESRETYSSLRIWTVVDSYSARARSSHCFLAGACPGNLASGSGAFDESEFTGLNAREGWYLEAYEPA